MKKLIVLIILLIANSVLVFSQGRWTSNSEVNIAKSSKAIPAFPRTLSEYRFAGKNKDFWGKKFQTNGSMRIFGGDDWTGVSDFPNTMNHCGTGMFMIRWRSTSRVASTVDFTKELASKRKKGKKEQDGYMFSQKIGQYGYMFSHNCFLPLFKVEGADGIIVDIYYELKFWQAAP